MSGDAKELDGFPGLKGAAVEGQDHPSAVSVVRGDAYLAPVFSGS